MALLLALIFKTAVICLFLYFVTSVVFKKRERPALRSVAIVVLGDIGRSPRMMYHAESFASHNFETYLIGYAGSRPIPSLLSQPHVQFLYLKEAPRILSKLPFALMAPLKILIQVTTILIALLIQIPHPPEFIMLQNPPSIPTLALVWLVSNFRGSKMIIDWHNLGYSILALKLGDDHVFVKMAKVFEATFGRCAYMHIFVTRAMQDALVKKWRLQGTTIVLHDRPPAHFHRSSAFETHDLMLRLRTSLSSPSLLSFFPPFSPPHSTPFTHFPHQGHSPYPSSSSDARLPELRKDRVALVVSSTSWTADEDFDILIEALRLYERRAKQANRSSRDLRSGQYDGDYVLPKIFMVVTGKGPLRDEYMDKVMRIEKEEVWKFVRCRSLWLEATDYPLLLGSADLGVCLHSSSSGLDLPMKVVDMFGCGLPVCALDFKCLPELVRENHNGLIFQDATELSEHLECLLATFPYSQRLRTLRENIDMAKATHRNEGARSDDRTWTWGTWTENWDNTVLPHILHRS